MVEIYSIGGYSESGKNMTAIRADNETVILDMGFYLPALIDFEEGGGDRRILSRENMIKIGAVPDDNVISSLKDSVKAIVLGHAHLDHIGPVPTLAQEYKAPIIASPYTIEVLKAMMLEDKLKIKNDLKPVNLNSIIKISKNISIELINVTHSTLQTAMIAVHTKEGTILYANDFKFDNHPVIGKKTNIERLKKIGSENVIALIVDSLYSNNDQKTPSEKVAREMLKDIMLGTENSENAIFATTFASHIARLKSLLDFGKALNRRVVFLGRSMFKYIKAAEKLNLAKFSGEAEIISYSNRVRKKLKNIKGDRNKYLFICTGGQGEPSSVLNKILTNKIPFEFKSGDHVIFSNRVIPVNPNLVNRKNMEENLKKRNIRIFKDLHVSVLPDTQVVVNDNKTMKIKEIQDVQNYEGLKVPAFNSDVKIKWYNAKLIKHKYSGNIFEIMTKSGRNVAVTSGHSLFRLKKGIIESSKSDNLKIGDYLAIQKRFSWRKELKEIDALDYLHIDKYNPINYDKKWIYYGKIKICPRKIKLDNDFAKISGYYLAEGSSPRGVSLVMSANEKVIINDFLISAKKIFPSNFTVKQRGNAIEIIFGANVIGRMFKRWFNSGAKNKKIPDFVFGAGDEFKIKFLSAYLNGDGSADNKKGMKIRVKTASKKLASDIIYLASQLGICAKFDCIEIGKKRFIANSKRMTNETKSYVVRIQGEADLLKLKGSLCSRFDKLFVARQVTLNYPPQTLPLKELNLEEIKARYNTNLKYYLDSLREGKFIKEKHVSIDILKRDSVQLLGVLKKIIDGDLAFDPIIEIKKKYYYGEVYDFEVPGVENFIGGFGGLMLHNSGHASREDIRDLITIVKPRHIIPGHGTHDKYRGLIDLCKDMGYNINKNVHVMSDGKKIEF